MQQQSLHQRPLLLKVMNSCLPHCKSKLQKLPLSDNVAKVASLPSINVISSVPAKFARAD